MFRDNPQRDLAMENMLCFYSCLCFSKPARGRGCYKASRLDPERQRTSLRGRTVPDTQVLKIGKQHTQLATALEVRKFTVRGGSEDLAVECHIFIVFLILRANIPHKNKECLYNPLPHVSHSSFDLGCCPALVEMTVGGNAVPEPSDLTCT